MKATFGQTCNLVDLSFYRCVISNYLMHELGCNSECPVADPVFRYCQKAQEFLKCDDDDAGIGIPIKGKSRQPDGRTDRQTDRQTDKDR